MKKSLTKLLARMARDGDVDTVAEFIDEMIGEEPETPAEDVAEKTESGPVTKAPAPADSPSFFYLAVAVITLILVAGAGVISGVHYLDFEHGLKYADKVPGLPQAK